MFNKQIMKMKYMEITVRLEDCPCMMFAGEDRLVEDVMENSLASDKEKTEVVRGILAEVCYWPALQIQIIAKFLDPKEDLYKDIEGPLSVLWSF